MSESPREWRGLKSALTRQAELSLEGCAGSTMGHEKTGIRWRRSPSECLIGPGLSNRSGLCMKIEISCAAHHCFLGQLEERRLCHLKY